jgi:NTE family protein
MQPGARYVTSADLPECFAQDAADGYKLAAWLAKIERENNLVICVVAPELNAWTDTALRASDQIVFVASGEGESRNPLGAEAQALFEKERRRLVVIQARRSRFAEPSARWLERCAALMVHHVCLGDGSDVDSFVRFLTGRAVGFVAGGGGAFGPAHVGIFKAFREMGVTFDIFGGSSVGSAMAGAFAMLADPSEISAALPQIFVRRRALNRFTWPRYGLLDHGVFDEELQRLYPGRIEDAWRPYFAVATDLSNLSVRVIREGPLWQAIRASCSIPGVLPPFIDENGHMLVDGGVADNVPVSVMHSLKAGPNLVIDLRPPEHCRYGFDYRDIPARREWIARALRPGPWNKALPRCPGPASVIQQTVFAKIGADSALVTPQDLVLRPPAFPGSNFMNWDRHQDVVDASHEWASREIESLLEQGDPALRAILDGAP